MTRSTLAWLARTLFALLFAVCAGYLGPLRPGLTGGRPTGG